jgi:hypothetical protein
MRKLQAVMMLSLGIFVCGPALGQAARSPAPTMRVDAPTIIANPYTAYEFLIGDWYSRPAGGPDIAIHQNFRWGTRQSYIYYTTSTRLNGAPEAIHFEGMLVWNGASHNLDYVIAAEPGSGGQEQGIMHAEPDGSVVRDVTMTRADGQVAHFRQTFRRTGPDTAMTSLMRQTATGWEPNFPGSDNIAMTRRPS